MLVPACGLCPVTDYSWQSEQQVKLKELAAPLQAMQQIARRIAKVSKDSKLEIVEEDYVAQFRIEMTDAVLQWCGGAKFVDICKVGPS